MSKELEAENRRLYNENLLLKEQVHSLSEALAEANADIEEAYRKEVGITELDFNACNYSTLGEEL